MSCIASLPKVSSLSPHFCSSLSYLQGSMKGRVGLAEISLECCKVDKLDSYLCFAFRPVWNSQALVFPLHQVLLVR